MTLMIGDFIQYTTDRGHTWMHYDRIMDSGYLAWYGNRLLSRSYFTYPFRVVRDGYVVENGTCP